MTLAYLPDHELQSNDGPMQIGRRVLKIEYAAEKKPSKLLEQFIVFRAWRSAMR